MVRYVNCLRYVRNIETGKLIADGPGRGADAKEEKNEDESDAGQRKVDVCTTVSDSDS